MTTDGGRSQLRYARLGGAMFLLVDALFAVGLLVAARFRVPGDVVATGQRVLQSEGLYRASLSCTVAAALCTVLIAVGLYGALRPVSRTLALTGLVFRTAEATVFGMLAVTGFGFLPLYTGAGASGFTPDQLAALAGVRAAIGDAGYNMAALFFSIGSIAFFSVFLESRYLPRALALLGLVGSILVPVACFGALIFELPASIYWGLWAPIGLAEVVTGVWLLVRGLDLGAAVQPARAPVYAEA